ncbi:protein ripply2 [Anolis carolinensis]|uniref:Ripply transcriptional repressor 2 n=1 Tax=Anolis carolinensis TaxID=28377 RepID=A0A803TKI3_ANOCA|nr:PREDICTED: protein ripply2 [Anolis carolinensis]|eukprot:XP_008119930.1 PREDICTED: protein ripply2 [Anolis carolinensis]
MESSPLGPRSPPHLGACKPRIPCTEVPRSERYWRPWIPTQKEAERQHQANHPTLGDSSETMEDSAKLTHYTHPVRLFWPKSRCFDYLYHEAEALLRNFPVQATLSFYEDSESEEEHDELDHGSEAAVDC